jgi:hypothetical protein
MNKTGYTDCPSCGDLISENARACSCGWKVKKQHKSLGMKRCSYSDRGNQCPKWATVDDSTCRYHMNWWDNPRAASQSLDLILRGEIGEDRNWREDAINEFQNAHPEFKVIPASRDEVKTCIDMVKKFMSKAKKLPYNKNKEVA